MRKRRRWWRKIERNRSKESCVLITQFHVLSVRSTSPVFVEAERSQLYHLRGATGSVIQPRIVRRLVRDQQAIQRRARRELRARLSLISRGRYLHSGKYPRLTPPANQTGRVRLSRSVSPARKYGARSRLPWFSHNSRASAVYAPNVYLNRQAKMGFIHLPVRFYRECYYIVHIAYPMCIFPFVQFVGNYCVKSIINFTEFY